MTSHKKTLSLWFLFVCVISLGFSLSWVFSNSIRLPVYSVGDYWIYNESETHYFDHNDPTTKIWYSSGLTTKNITAIEQIYDQQGKKKICYVQKIETALIYHFYDGNISYETTESLEYLDTQTLECVESTVRYNRTGDPLYYTYGSESSNYGVENCSKYNCSSHTLYPLVPGKTGDISYTQIYDSIYYQHGEWHNYTGEPYEKSFYFIITTFSNLSTVLGVFSGIKVELQKVYWWPHYHYYSPNIGSYILETYSTGNDCPTYNGSTELWTRRQELIEYHYTNETIGFNISGSPAIFIAIAGTSVGFLYLILKRRQRVLPFRKKWRDQ